MATHDMTADGSTSIKLLSKIGSGEYGVVYIGRDEGRNGRIVAVKKFRAAGQSQATLYRELSIQQRLDCDHIVRVEDVVCLPKKSVLVLEYVPMTLSCFIDAHSRCAPTTPHTLFSNYYMPRGLIKQIFRGILVACDYLHARRIAHRDINPNNILLKPFEDLTLTEWANGDKHLLQEFIHGGVCCGNQRCRDRADRIYRDYVRPHRFPPTDLVAPSASTALPSTPRQHASESPAPGDQTQSPSCSSRGPSESSRSSPAASSDEFPWSAMRPVAKMADFGVARMDGMGLEACHLDKQRVHTPLITTFPYAAPEVMVQHTYGTAADMFSAGCVLFELATGHVLNTPNDLYYARAAAAVSPAPCANDAVATTPPMSGPGVAVDPLCYWMRMFQVLGSPTEEEWAEISSEAVHGQPSVLANNLPKFPRERFTEGPVCDALGREGCDLLRRLLAYNPKQRITAEEALNHPFFAS